MGGKYRFDLTSARCAFTNRCDFTSIMWVFALVVLIVTLQGCGGGSKPPSPAPSPAVDSNVILANGVSMPLLAAGTWQYHDDEAKTAVMAAIKAGFKHIDTAHDYDNQKAVGEGLKESGVKREDVFITSKVPGCGLQGLRADDCKGNTLKLIQEDIAQIKSGGYDVQYLDLILLHFPPCPQDDPLNLTSPTNSQCHKKSSGCWMENCKAIQDQWAGVEEAYKQKLVKAVGVSNYCSQCFDCLAKDIKVHPMVNQVQVHVGMGPDPQGFVSFAKSKKMVLQAWSPLGAGGKGSKEILSGKLTTGIASAHKKTAPQVALKWLIKHGLSIATKSDKPEHLAQNLDLFDWDLTDDEMASLDAADFAKDDTPSFMCKQDVSQSTVV